ncbi:hypothetical protein [Pedobacter sp. ASV28]|nr:hypothetical protein [Pedobacter sp. ASV28]
MKNLKIQKKTLFSFKRNVDAAKRGAPSDPPTTTIASMYPTCPAGTGFVK